MAKGQGKYKGRAATARAKSAHINRLALPGRLRAAVGFLAGHRITTMSLLTRTPLTIARKRICDAIGGWLAQGPGNDRQGRQAGRVRG
jgi:hypothetical protein